MAADALQVYRGSSVLTASGSELTLMLYEGAIKFINRAIVYIDKCDIKNAHENIVRAQDIVTELQITIDKKYPIAKEILKLYDFIQELLLEGNLRKDKVKLEQANELLREFRDTWKQLLKK